MYDKFEKQEPFTPLDTSKYPPEVKGRFNSFITTQFDDSLSVEMQMRSIIKWINSSRDLVNDMTEYLNLFIEQFDKRLQQEIAERLTEWLEDGTLAQVINEDVFNMKADKTDLLALESTLNGRMETFISETNQRFSNFEVETSNQLDELDNKKANITYVDNEIQNNKRIVKYGDITLPNDFYTPDNVLIPLNLYRNANGEIKHNLNLETLNRHIQVHLYVDTDNGSNIDGDGSENSPYQTVGRAFQDIDTYTQGRFKIVIDGNMLLLAEFFVTSGEPLNFDGKNVTITTKNNKKIPVVNGWSSHRGPISITTGNESPALNWGVSSGSVYKITRTNVLYVIDTKVKDSYGGVAEMYEAQTQTECYNTPGSYYTDGDSVQVHTFDSRKPDKQVFVVAQYAYRGLNVILRNSVFTIQNLQFFTDRGLLIDGDKDSVFGMGNFEIGRTSEFNGLSVLNVGTTYLLDGIVHGAKRDGLNYTYSGMDRVDRERAFVYEDNIKSYDNGLRDENVNNNSSSAHQGVNVLRTNGLYGKSRGPVVNDVHGCYSVLIDCQSNDSVLTTSRGNSFQFTTDPEVESQYRNAKVVLIDSGGRSPNKSIVVDDPTELVLKGWLEDRNTIEVRSE